MVPILAKQALARKCEFSNAKMTGNYECAYALGVVSGALAIPKAENVITKISANKTAFCRFEKYPASFMVSNLNLLSRVDIV